MEIQRIIVSTSLLERRKLLHSASNVPYVYALRYMNVLLDGGFTALKHLQDFDAKLIPFTSWDLIRLFFSVNVYESLAPELYMMLSR